MITRLLMVAALLLGMSSSLQAGAIWFPSRITNGSFERWQGNSPVGWKEAGWISASPTDPFLGEYAVELSNSQPWAGFIYQEFSYSSGSFLFGCAHWSWYNWGDKIWIIYYDAQMNQISSQSWYSHPGDWQIILTVLRPPEDTATIRIELEPQLDALGILIVDHVFVVPLGGLEP